MIFNVIYDITEQAIFHKNITANKGQYKQTNEWQGQDENAEILRLLWSLFL